MSKIKFFFVQSWLLLVASFGFGLLLAATNAAWQPRIIQNEKDKFNNLANVLVSEATSFEVALEAAQIDMGKGKFRKTDIKKALNADGQCVGWAFIAEGAGFADKIRLVLAVDAKFEKLAGFGVLSSNETPGFGDKIKNDFFRIQFIGAPTDVLELFKIGDATIIDSRIVAISGATVSSEAVVKILNNYIKQAKSLLQKEGSI
jgi:H+/Na+-translocating ferredoxin:NAD+ oxidoreductase subunit G